MATNKKISDLDFNPSIDGTEEIPTVKGGDNFKNTYTGLKTWLQSVLSFGVETVTGDGVDNADPKNPELTFPKIDEVGEEYTTDVNLKSTTGNSFTNESNNGGIGIYSKNTQNDTSYQAGVFDTESGNRSDAFFSETLAVVRNHSSDGDIKNELWLTPTQSYFGCQDTSGATLQCRLYLTPTKAEFRLDVHGNGLKYLSGSDYSNVSWLTSSEVLPPIGMIKANLPSKTEVEAKEDKASPQVAISSTPQVISTTDASKTFNVFGVGALCDFNINTGALLVGQSITVNIGDSDGIDFVAGGGVNVIGVITGSTTVFDTVMIIRLPDASFGLTGEVYKVM